MFVNCGGPKADGFIGRSAVTLPFKGKVGGTETNEEEVAYVEVDLDVLKVSRLDKDAPMQEDADATRVTTGCAVGVWEPEGFGGQDAEGGPTQAGARPGRCRALICGIYSVGSQGVYHSGIHSQ